jgi:hypothetical protein
MFHKQDDYALLDAELELSSEELELVLGGDSPEVGNQADDQQPNSGNFQQSLGNVSNAGGTAAIAGGIIGGTIGVFVGSFAGPAGTTGGAVGGAEVGGLVGGALGGAAAAGWEVGSTYAQEISAFGDSMVRAAQDYQDNPPPI